MLARYQDMMRREIGGAWEMHTRKHDCVSAPSVVLTGKEIVLVTVEISRVLIYGVLVATNSLVVQIDAPYRIDCTYLVLILPLVVLSFPKGGYHVSFIFPIYCPFSDKTQLLVSALCPFCSLVSRAVL